MTNASEFNGNCAFAVSTGKNNVKGGKELRGYRRKNLCVFQLGSKNAVQTSPLTREESKQGMGKQIEIGSTISPHFFTKRGSKVLH